MFSANGRRSKSWKPEGEKSAELNSSDLVTSEAKAKHITEM
jgi:hypothetical protein